MNPVMILQQSSKELRDKMIAQAWASKGNLGEDSGVIPASWLGKVNFGPNSPAYQKAIAEAEASEQNREGGLLITEGTHQALLDRKKKRSPSDR